MILYRNMMISLFKTGVVKKNKTQFPMTFTSQNKISASTAPCPATAFTSSFTTLSKIKCVLHVLSLYIFASLQGNLWNYFQIIERAHIYELDHY